MPRFFFGNFDFEHRLAEPTREPTAKLKRLNEELASSWLAIAEAGDWIWTPSPIDVAFFREREQHGLPRIHPVVSLSDVPRDVECIPWGWSNEVRRYVDCYGWKSHAPSDTAVKYANSRSTSEKLEREWNVSLPYSRRIESLEDLSEHLRSLPDSCERWVIKAEFGMSARERILGRGCLTTSDEHWVRRRLVSSGVVFFEPWVDRFGEIGIQIDVPISGQPEFVGVTPMLVDQRGQYAGSWFSDRDVRFDTDRTEWSSAIETALRAASYLQTLGYFGPLGIDSMIYRDSNGYTSLRPLQDINARWTMGRLSLGWKRLLQDNEVGCWHRGSAAALPEGLNVTRQFSTRPDHVGGNVSHHQTHVIIGTEISPRPTKQAT